MVLAAANSDTEMVQENRLTPVFHRMAKKDRPTIYRLYHLLYLRVLWDAFECVMRM